MGLDAAEVEKIIVQKCSHSIWALFETRESPSDQVLDVLLWVLTIFFITEKSRWGVKSIMVSDLPVYHRIATSITV